MNKIVLLLAFITFINSTSVLAEMYKWVDKEGNISYSDQPPFKGAKKLDPPQISTTPAVAVPEKKTTPKKTEEKLAKYSFFKITSPENDATIRDNNGNFTISMRSKPALNVAEGHYISVLLDGKAIQKQSSTTVNLSNIDRGTHKISAVIKNKNNQVLRKAKTITVHLHRQTILRKQP